MVKARGLYGDASIYHYIVSSDQPLSQSVFHEYGCNCVLLGVNPRRLPADVSGNLFRRPSQHHGLTWNLSHRRGHGICFSVSGGAKNTNLITPALLSYAGSVFCLDPKGENSWITANRRRQLGQKVVILDPWDQVNTFYGSRVNVREIISRFNPLSTLDPTSAEFSEEILLIADGVIITPQGADPHWGDSARELISGLIAAVVEKKPGFASFRDVRDLLTETDERLSLAVTDIVESNPNSLAGRKLRRFVPKQKFDKKGNPLPIRPVSNEISSIRSTAETQTAIFDAVKLLDSMETDTAQPDAFNLSELITGRVSLFIVLPPDKLLTHGRWMRLIIQLALRAIAREPSIPRFPILFILDELGTINPGAGLKMIEQAYGLLGSQGIRVWSFFQNISQIRHDYPASWETMIANSEMAQIGTVNDNSTAEYFSSKLGTYTIDLNADQPYDPKDFTRKPPQYVGRALRTPLELMQLPENNFITMLQKRHPFQLPTRAYYLEPRFDGMYRPNTRYPLPAWAKRAGPGIFPPWSPNTPLWNTGQVHKSIKRPAIDVEAIKAKAMSWWKAGRKAAADALKAREAARVQADRLAAVARSQAERQAREDASHAERMRRAETMRDAK